MLWPPTHPCAPPPGPPLGHEALHLLALARRLRQQDKAASTRNAIASAVRRYERSCRLYRVAAFPFTYQALALFHVHDVFHGKKKASSVVKDASSLKSHATEHDIGWLLQRGEPLMYKQLLGGIRAADPRPTERPPPLTLDEIAKKTARLARCVIVVTAAWGEGSFAAPSHNVLSDSHAAASGLLTARGAQLDGRAAREFQS